MLRALLLLFLTLWLIGLVFKIAIEITWAFLVIAVVLGIADMVKRRSVPA